MSKILGFLLGIVVAIAGPAAFGVLATGGDIELNPKETALVFGVWALALWLAVSMFSGAAALGAALTFGAMSYLVHFIPNRTTDFLNDVPGVTNGMIDGLKSSVLTGLVPVLTVITLVYALQLMTRAVTRRRNQRADEARLEEERESIRAERTTAGDPDDGGYEQQPPATTTGPQTQSQSLYDPNDPASKQYDPTDTTTQYRPTERSI